MHRPITVGSPRYTKPAHNQEDKQEAIGICSHKTNSGGFFFNNITNKLISNNNEYTTF